MGKTGRVIELSEYQRISYEKYLLYLLEQRDILRSYWFWFCTVHIAIVHIAGERNDVHHEWRCLCLDDEHIMRLTYDELIQEYQRLIDVGVTGEWSDLVP